MKVPSVACAYYKLKVRFKPFKSFNSSDRVDSGAPLSFPFPIEGKGIKQAAAVCSHFHCVSVRKLMNRKNQSDISTFREFSKRRNEPGWSGSSVSCLLSRWSGGRWPFTHGVSYHGLGDPFYEFGGHGHEHETRVELGA